MERYLFGDAERNQTIQPGERGVARSPMNDIAFIDKKASKVSAVLTGYAGDEGHLGIEGAQAAGFSRPHPGDVARGRHRTLRSRHQRVSSRDSFSFGS